MFPDMIIFINQCTGKELYGYAHICICYVCSLLAMQAGTSYFQGSPC